MGTSSAMSTSNQYIKYKITVTQNSQNVANNYSNVTVTVRFYRTNTGYTTYGTGTVYCKINGTTYSASVSPSQKITNSGINLFSKTLNIYHNADGTKTLTCSAWISHERVTSSEQSYSQTLTTIPRASSITLSSSTTVMGNALTITISRASSSFTHKLTWAFGNTNGTIGTGLTTSGTWTLPLSLANQIPNATSGYGNINCYTYSGSTLIGSTSVRFYATVPTSVVPTIDSVTLTETTSGLATQFGGFVKGKSKVKGVISASGAYSSTIKSYSIKINGATYTSSSFTTDYLTGSGACVVTVKDSRGRTASKTVNYTCYDYTNPSISTFNVSRCNSDGTANDEGTYAKCTIKAVISPVNNKNTKTFKLLYKKISASEYTTVNLSNSNYTLDTSTIITGIDTESEYNFILQTTDYFITTSKSQNLSTAFTLMDFNASGKGVAFGQVSSFNGMEINMDLHANKGVWLSRNSDEEKNIWYRNLASSLGKTYDTDGVYPHQCRMYGGSQTNPNAIGWWDNAKTYNILFYNDYTQQLTYGNKGLYSPSPNGVYFDQYGNVITRQAMTTGNWNIINDGTTYFHVGWGDKLIYGGIGDIYQAKLLYENTSGTNGTITLSDSAENYTWLELCLRTSDGDRFSQRVYWANERKITLSASNYYETTIATYLKVAIVTINGKTITWAYNAEAGIKNESVSTVKKGNFIYIERVFGHK